MTARVCPLRIAHIIEATAIIGGTDGFVGVDSFSDVWLERYLILIFLLGSTFSLRRLMTTDLGLVLRSISDNDQAARASGINITFYKLIAVWIGSALGSFAGAYFTHLYMFVWYMILLVVDEVSKGLGVISAVKRKSFPVAPREVV